MWTFWSNPELSSSDQDMPFSPALFQTWRPKVVKFRLTSIYKSVNLWRRKYLYRNFDNFYSPSVLSKDLYGKLFSWDSRHHFFCGQWRQCCYHLWSIEKSWQFVEVFCNIIFKPESTIGGKGQRITGLTAKGTFSSPFL